MTPKPRPAKRGYVLGALLSAFAIWAGAVSLHVNYLIAAGIVISGIIALTGILSWKSRGVNAEARRRR